MKRVEVSNPFDEELTLPRPARLPVAILPPGLAQLAVTPTTVAPTAMDVEAGPRPSPKARRLVDLVAVGAAAFTLAWIVRGAQMAPSTSPSAARPAVATAPITSAVPYTLPACAPAKSGATTAASFGIPIVSVTDLPLLGSATPGQRRSRPRALERADAPGRGELQAALSQVASVASSCGERGGPVRVVVSFARSGVARSIRVSGAALPAATRSCIIGAASRAHIHAFSGEPVTVAKTL